MRFIGLDVGRDVGRDFAHVAVVDGSGTARRLPRVAMGDFRAPGATLGGFSGWQYTGNAIEWPR